ncbi:hypothetical protein ACXAUS_000439 [Clostridium sporogenes]|uniref:hypothetical protein n=1 Tax=Clostridium sporogenes TaxID=1509 RepID=UPI0013D87AAF|nr:hypothetical protein [Clostridium sporogenes]MDU1323247.1 hypothetical protein [Clostridium botulinum]MDU1420279.1 hypothetical protein [Clostridium botulinum]NFP91609.1 hypothetical protein [Clostridium sporogenes]
MKWTKKGKIFDPRDHKLSNECYEYAQSPQALVCDDFVRIYFSTRKKDENGKFLSHISFVDMDKEFNKIIKVSKDTVIELGDLGCFDEHGIFPMNVLKYENKVLGYTCGWNRRTSVSVDTSIGLAISYDNGITFKKNGQGPIMTSSLHEPFLVGDPFVQIYDDVFHMWYIFGIEWKIFPGETDPQRIYKIGHATSKDGIEWERDSKPIITEKFEDESQALPTIIKLKNRYHMFFCYRQSSDFRENKNRGYRLGYAFSDDLVNWARDDEKCGIEVTEGSWDSDMLCYPHIFKCDDNIYMLYNGNEFGKHGFGLAKLEDDTIWK